MTLPRPLFTVLAIATVALASGCQSGQPKSRAPSDQYSFWPPLPNEPRIQYLTSYRFSSDVEAQRSALDELVFGTEREVLPIAKPYGVAMWRDRIYVCDTTNPGVVILDLEKQETRLMATTGVQPMRQPIDIDIASDGMKYIVDRRLGRIFVFNGDDRFAGIFGSPGFTPVAAASHGNELFVSDFDTQSVVVLDRFSGETLRTIGSAGGDEGQFIRPLGIAVDDDGYLYVSDVIRGRIQKFTTDGQLVFALGELADSPGNFVRPKHVAVDREGLVYVVDAAFENVQMFSQDGELLMYFGSPGSHPGSMSLPAGITVYDGDLGLFQDYLHPAFEAHRLVLVSNQFGLNKVSVYALGQLKQGSTVADIAPYAAPVDSGLRTEEEVAADRLQQPGGLGAAEDGPDT